MRTIIDIDDALLDAAMTAMGLATKKATVEYASQILVERHCRSNAIATLSGTGWEGDLDEIRRAARAMNCDRRLEAQAALVAAFDQAAGG